MKKILLVEDGDDIGVLVRTGLNAYIVQQAYSVNEGRAALRETEFDLILIDVTLPDGSGFDLCLELSQDLKYSSVPKILLTARQETADKVYGFTCGAQDYVTKPFHMLELKARVERLLPKTNAAGDNELVHSCFVFNRNFQKCFMIDEIGSRQDLRLTPTEFRLFLVLAKSEGQTLSRKFLEQAAWEANGAFIQIRGVDTHIAHLRKKLGTLGSVIVSVYGQGYAFQSKAADSLAA